MRQWPTCRISLSAARRRSALRTTNASLSMCRWSGTACGRLSTASCARSSPGTSTSPRSRFAFSGCWMRRSGRFGPPPLPPPGKQRSGLAQPGARLFVSIRERYGAARQGCLAVTCSDSSTRTTPSPFPRTCARTCSSASCASRRATLRSRRCSATAKAQMRLNGSRRIPRSCSVAGTRVSRSRDCTVSNSPAA